MGVGLPGGSVCDGGFIGAAPPALTERKDLGVPRHSISSGWCVNMNVAMKCCFVWV